MPLRIVPDGSDGPLPGFVTGYYEPVVDASPVRTERFRFPALPAAGRSREDRRRQRGRPASTPLSASRGACRTATSSNIRTAPRSRTARWRRAAWRSPGSTTRSRPSSSMSRVRPGCALRTGAQVRVGYAAKTGHAFTAIGRILLERGELTPRRGRHGRHQGLARGPSGRGPPAPPAQPFVHLLPRISGRQSRPRPCRRGQGAADGARLDRGRPAACHLWRALFHLGARPRPRRLAGPPADDRAGYRLGDSRPGPRRYLHRLRPGRGLDRRPDQACSRLHRARPAGAGRKPRR